MPHVTHSRALLLGLLILAVTSTAVAALHAADAPPPPPAAPPAGAPTPQGIEFFEKRIRPLLAEHCFACHNSKAESPMGALRLDSRAGAYKGGDRGPAVVPGSLEKSLLIKAVRYQHRELAMPPKGKLPAEKIADLEEWVRLGAPWPGGDPPSRIGPTPAAEFAKRAKHWSFQPLRAVVPPRPRDARWVRNPIDAFVLAKLEAARLTPAPAADRRTLIRRVTYDLTGLPPTPAEVQAFLADTSPNAFEKVVDRLLASPHYGERWARHWLDLVRFAETDGHEFDFEKPNAWHYRDYVIRALNADVPYDQFVREHLAGDLLPNPRRDPRDGANESVIGTGFFFFGEGKHSPVDLLEDERERIDNQIDVTTRTFLGLSLGCARCHDHKFDPISAKDYYALSGFVKSGRYQLAALDNPEPLRRAAAELAAVNSRLRPAVSAQAGSAYREGLGGLADTLLAARDVLRGADPAAAARDRKVDPAALAQRVKYLRETAAKDPADPLHAWAQLALDRRATAASLAAALRSRAAAPRLVARVFEDFNARGYDNWFVTGEAFGAGPTASPTLRLGGEGARPERVDPAGIADSGAASDRLQGALRSQTFRIEKPLILFRMAGRDTTVNLIIDSFQRIRFPIYGGLTLPLKSPQLAWHQMDVSKWVGHRAYIEVLDHGRGYVALDRILFADGAAPPPAPPAAVLTLLEAPTSATPEALARGYEDLFRQAADAWAGGGDPTPAAPLVNWLLTHEPGPAAACDAQMASLAQQRRVLEGAIPDVRRAMAMTEGTPENDRVHIRGSHKQLGVEVPRRFLEVFGAAAPPPGDRSTGRLALADRMVASPLLARVIVNRLWQHHFGEGIVRTPDDFGLRCDPPTHPELLEWLSGEIRRQGWSLKKMHRLMLLSSTYRMAAKPAPAAQARDPQNRLLHSMPVRRLEAEAIRDGILAVSGRLDRRQFGPGVLPHLTPFMEGRGRPGASGPVDGDGRRSIYLNVRRNFLNPMFLAFDYPVPFNTMGRRTVSTVPAQALVLMNNPFVLQQAARWAQRELEAGGSPSERVQRMYQAALARPATPAEAADAVRFVEEARQRYGAGGDQKAWTDLAHVLFNVKEFIFIN
jgi:hypothetical protein